MGLHPSETPHRPIAVTRSPDVPRPCPNSSPSPPAPQASATASARPAPEALGLIPSVGGLLLPGKAAVHNAAQENDSTPRLHQKQGGERGSFTVSPKPLGQHLPTQQEGEGAVGKPPVRVSERNPPAEPTARGELERGAQGSVLGCVSLTGAQVLTAR